MKKENFIGVPSQPLKFGFRIVKSLVLICIHDVVNLLDDDLRKGSDELVPNKFHLIYNRRGQIFDRSIVLETIKVDVKDA
jgi:hypothetical protein